LFEEPGKLEEVVEHARQFFLNKLVQPGLSDSSQIKSSTGCTGSMTTDAGQDQTSQPTSESSK
jgi:hypothetical protein